jgi:SAM-dependent methyltransferase
LYLTTCSGCGVVFQPIAVDVETLSQWYDYMGEEHKSISSLIERRLLRTLQSLQQYHLTGRLLEVGCGSGFLVRAAIGKGWEVFGTEISPSCCSGLRPVLNSRLFEGELPRSSFENNSFDVIVMMEVIEHLTDPLSYLRTAFKLLRPGGCILLSTPNLRGASGRLLGYRWRVMGDEHLNYFDKRTISKLVRAAGFQSIVIRTTNLDVGVVKEYVRHFSASIAPTPNNESSAIGGSAAVDRSRLATITTRAIDLLMESTNLLIGALSIGDTLKVWAKKPAVFG